MKPFENIIFLLWTAFLPSGLAQFKLCNPIPDGWYDLNGNCFYFGKESLPKNWNEAKKVCELKESFLASINNEQETEYIKKAFNDSLLRGDAWIGLSGSNSHFDWDDGTPLTYEHWTSDKQSTTAKRKCIKINREGEWDPGECDLKLNSFICKRNINKTTTDKPPEEVNCMKDWIQFEDKCFKIFGNGSEETFENASLKCQSTGNGNDLASIHSSEENDFITTILGLETINIRIGLLKKERYANRREWIDKSTFNFEKWAIGEPSSKFSLDEPCVEMLQATNRAGKWNDVICNSTRGYLCQSKPNPNNPKQKLPTNECKMKDYKRYKNACYKIETENVDFESAELSCREANGHLASIMDYYEQAFINTISRKLHKRLWIGYSNINEKQDGIFRWTDQWPSKFTYWGANQPQGNFKNPACVIKSLNNNYWEVKDCDFKLGYVCKINDEKPPEINVVKSNCPISEESSANWLDVGTDYCYYATDLIANWTDANETCAKMEPSAQLASFHSKNELELIANLNLNNSMTNMWIGLRRTPEGGFEWSDESPADFVNWAVNQPKISATDSCVQITTNDMCFKGDDCSKKFGFMCAISKETEPKITSTEIPLTEPSADPVKSPEVGLTDGSIAAISVCTILGIFGTAGIAYYVIKKRRNRSQSQEISLEMPI